MKARQLLAVALISFAYSSDALAAPKHTVRRGEVLVIETQFTANAKVQAAFLTWQTFDYSPISDHEMIHRHHDANSPDRKGMATTFGCDADVVTNNSGVVLSCKVPLDVADGNYFLTAVSIRTNDSERKYTWLGDLPTDIEVRIKGGEELIVPEMRSITVKQSSQGRP